MGVPRKVVQIAAAGMSEAGAWPVLYALADDGTLWVLNGGPPWAQIDAPLPEAEACGARAHVEFRDESQAECQLAKGHGAYHWNGRRSWA